MWAADLVNQGDFSVAPKSAFILLQEVRRTHARAPNFISMLIDELSSQF